MPLFFAISLIFFSERFSILILVDRIFLNIRLLLALSCTKFDDVAIDKCGSKYIICFSKAYLLAYYICSTFLATLQLLYNIFMHLHYISVISIYSLLGRFQ